jgi:hypothetical protein
MNDKNRFFFDKNQIMKINSSSGQSINHYYFSGIPLQEVRTV